MSLWSEGKKRQFNKKAKWKMETFVSIKNFCLTNDKIKRERKKKKHRPGKIICYT